MPIQMNQLFDNIPKLPQIPEVVRTIINQLNDPQAEMLDIAKNVEKEQVISLKILRLVNSAHFGLSRKINSIDEATVMLGMNQLKTLVITSGIVCSMPKIENFDLRKFWNNCFRTAVYAKWLAEQSKLSGDIAYTAGLIGNLGNLLIHIGLPSEANEIDQHTRAGHSSRATFERNCLGFTNQDVCAELCRRWKFGDELIEAIQHSGEPLTYQQPSPIACCLHLAQFISDAVDKGRNEADILAALPLAIGEKIGLSEAFFDAKLAEITALKSNLEGLND
ncbi:HDOD domain-containing protein [Methylomonas sp. SURF-2]|uniref:HDOD domain-containing protein n=1 Tax=Methylomonas subterranea TaxID=2952225 RepID=A0ABT1THW6_9GAMM|nr:HDOD domain-containing protein [Methylomonas sp. SURF-2]MCQ8105059.1 HDOD domain-containing protein [Methylomonas sp. SURF-2]